MIPSESMDEIWDGRLRVGDSLEGTALLYDVRGAACVGRHLDVPLLLDAVQVLVQAVQQERQQLLAVLLLVARELRREPRQRALECPRCHAADAGLQPAGCSPSAA